MSSPEQPLQRADEPPEHKDVPYERKDIHLGCIVAPLIVTVCGFVLVFALDWYFFGAQREAEQQRKASEYLRASQEEQRLPPQPRLEPINRIQQPTNETYYQQLVRMNEQLHSYGPMEKGFVHIPIEQAMKEIVHQLPVAKQPSDEAVHPVHAGGTDSGRMLPGAPPWGEY